MAHKAGGEGGRAASLVEPGYGLPPQAPRFAAIVRQPRQQLGSQLLLALPAITLVQHMGGLPQRPLQPAQPRAGSSQREISQQRIDPLLPQPRHQPGELPQRLCHHSGPLFFREVCGQVAHQVGPGVGLLAGGLCQGPAMDLLDGGGAIHHEAIGPAIAPFIRFTQPLGQGDMIEAMEDDLVWFVVDLLRAGDKSQQIMHGFEPFQNLPLRNGLP